MAQGGGFAGNQNTKRYDDLAKDMRKWVRKWGIYLHIREEQILTQEGVGSADS